MQVWIVPALKQTHLLLLMKTHLQITQKSWILPVTNFIYVYTSEMGILTSGETILNTTKDDYGKVIVTGYTDSSFEYTVYSLNKINSDHVLQMRLIFPVYTDEEDRMQKWYLTECFYRMCGFSDADPWRSYTEYVRENS